MKLSSSYSVYFAHKIVKWNKSNKKTNEMKKMKMVKMPWLRNHELWLDGKIK